MFYQNMGEPNKMNQLIKQLLEESTEVQDDWKTGLSVYVVNHKTFAELIVQECAEAVKNSVWHLPRGYKAADQAEFVKKHFGMNP